MTPRRAILAAAIVLGICALREAGAVQLSDTFTNWVDHPAIAYRTTPTTDPVGSLNARLSRGDEKLRFEGVSGYLRSVLAALEVPVESQIAVFAKDSVQMGRIAMNNPRTLFFNDRVVVGWVRGGFIELAAQDPRQGVVFYELAQSTLAEPRLVRHDECLSCHYSYNSAGVPGMLVKSAGHTAVDHTLPLEERWGGWYVTGSHGAIRHLGNTDLGALFSPERPSNTFNWPSFADKFNADGYLSTQSDIVALMVFTHQMHLMNLLTRIGWEARVAATRVGRPSPQDDAPIPLARAAVEVVDYMLFVDEAPLTSPIKGSSGFTARFESEGPRDGRGRSLRQLDLQRRLLRYPCSYMIYSPLFDALPGDAKDAIYRRMWRVLSGAERGEKYQRSLPLRDRQEIVDILRDTKPDLPSYFKPVKLSAG